MQIARRVDVVGRLLKELEEEWGLRAAPLATSFTSFRRTLRQMPTPRWIGWRAGGVQWGAESKTSRFIRLSEAKVRRDLRLAWVWDRELSEMEEGPAREVKLIELMRFEVRTVCSDCRSARASPSQTRDNQRSQTCDGRAERLPCLLPARPLAREPQSAPQSDDRGWWCARVSLNSERLFERSTSRRRSAASTRSRWAR